MDGGLTRDLYHVELPQRSSSSDVNNTASTWWQRSVKRKYDDVSLNGPRNSVLGNADVWKGSCSSEVAQGTIPRKGYCQRASCSSREAPVRTRISDVDEKVDEGYSEQLNCLELRVPVLHLSGPFSLSEDQTLDAEDVELDVERSHNNEGGERIILPKKTRFFGNLRSRSQTSLEVGPVQDSASERDIIQLREALISERKALNRLYVELEEERRASATAANEAMAMIARLQEEKAAILMEAHQYRRVAEEREVHNREAIALFKEFVLNKEDDLLALQDQIEAYETMFLRIESGGLGLGQINLLEGLEKGGSLFLEDQRTTSLPSGTGSKYGKGHWQSQIGNNSTCVSKRAEGDLEFQSPNLELSGPKTRNQPKPLVSGGVRMNLAGFFDDVGCGYDERQVVNVAVRNLDTGQWTSESSVNRKHSLDENMTGERQRFEESEMVGLTSGRMHQTFETYKSETVNDVHSQEQNLEDASASILARVKRLEERFQDLGKMQASEDQGINLNAKALQNNVDVIRDVDSEKTASSSWDSAPEAVYDKSKRYSEKIEAYTQCSSLKRGVKDWENGFHSENLPMATGERGAPPKVSDFKKYRPNGCRASPTPEDVCIESEGDPEEGVHDVYEVHYDIKETSEHHSECVIMDYIDTKNGLEKPDVMSVSSLQESISTLQQSDPKCMESLSTMTNKHGALSGEPEGCGPETDKLSFDRSSLDVKDVHKSTAEEGVHQLRIRLQGLESERVFMKQAIDSLRKENIELKLLQEIAQQLRELKDVKNTGQLKETLQQDQLSISSFFKGILSFAGLQNTVDTEGNRFMWPFQKNLEFKVNKENHDGLFHLLEKPRSQTSACVTRGLKVRIPGSGETGSLSQSPLVQPSAVYC